jgi:hypothetical protein
MSIAASIRFRRMMSKGEGRKGIPKVITPSRTMSTRSRMVFRTSDVISPSGSGLQVFQPAEDPFRSTVEGRKGTSSGRDPPQAGFLEDGFLMGQSSSGRLFTTLRGDSGMGLCHMLREPFEHGALSTGSTGDIAAGPGGRESRSMASGNPYRFLSDGRSSRTLRNAAG